MMSANDASGERGTGMELRKSRRSPLPGIFSLVVGVFLLVCGLTDRPFRSVGVLVFGGIALVAGGALVVHALKPFRFHIGAEGLTLRLRHLNRLVRWEEIVAGAGGGGFGALWWKSFHRPLPTTPRPDRLA